MITHKFNARLKQTMAGSCNIALQVELTYDEEFDPFAVQVILSAPEEEDVVWTVGRELLLRGVRSYNPVGNGDVRLRYLGTSDGGMLMCLRNLTGHADIWLPAAEVIAFLNLTMDAVKLGEEDVGSILDEALEEILNG